MSLQYIARFPFNDAGNLLSDTRDSSDLMLETGSLSSFTDPIYGEVLHLDGSTSLLSSGNFDTIVSDAQRSFSFWVNTTSLNSPVLSYGSLDGPNAFILYSTNSSGYITFSDLSTESSSSYLSSTNTWYFICFTYSNGSLNVYVNGSIVDTVSLGTLTTDVVNSIRIGTDGTGGYFEGYISDLRVYDSVLNDASITYMYESSNNHEEPLSHGYVESMGNLGTASNGPVICRESYGIQDKGSDFVYSSFAQDGSGNTMEASRISHKEENSKGSIKAELRHTNDDMQSYMTPVIESSSEETYFIKTGTDDGRNSVVFTPDGVKISSDSPHGIYFGESKDFRIVFVEGDNITTSDTLKIEAYQSSSGSYKTKFEVGN